MSQDNLEMYSEAHDVYDSTNSLLSLSTDVIVRERAAEESLKGNPRVVIDIATGTGEMALCLARIAERRGIKASILGIDANTKMLGVAKAKLAKTTFRNVSFRQGDALKLGFPSRHADVAVCSFSVKNFDNIGKFASEAYRILKRGGKLVVLDQARPEGPVERQVFNVYLAYMGLIGLTSGKKLYRWLPDSTSSFDKNALLRVLRTAGFKDISLREHLLGMAYVITCRK